MLDDARALLYQVYVAEQKWHPHPDNPSEIRVIDASDGRKLLVDKYDAHAIWTVAYYKDKLIACGRSCERDCHHKFEVQYYSSAQDVNDRISINEYPKLVEMTRAAIHRDFRNTGVFLLLACEILKYFNLQQTSVFTLSGEDKLIRLYKTIGFPMSPGIKFKYESEDKNAVSLFVASHEQAQLTLMINNLEQLLRNINLGQHSFFKAVPPNHHNSNDNKMSFAPKIEAKF